VGFETEAAILRGNLFPFYNILVDSDIVMQFLANHCVMEISHSSYFHSISIFHSFIFCFSF